MSRIFIGGSRAVSRLNPAVRRKLDELIAGNVSILIGDANGADKAVQRYLQEQGYRRVTVYYMDRRRNNVGSWPEKSINPPRGSKGFARYAAGRWLWLGTPSGA
jgi:adenine-specific DNA-methyltransferase